MSAIDPTTPLGSEAFSLGASRLRETRDWLNDAWLAFTARFQDGSTPNDPATSTGAFHIPTTAPGAPGVGDMYITTTHLVYGYKTGPTSQLIGDLEATSKVGFIQSAAPTGWTRDTGQTNASFLRYIQSGAPGGGGTVDPATGFGGHAGGNASVGGGGSYFVYSIPSDLGTHLAYAYLDTILAAKD